MAKVGIYMPAYNVEKYVFEAIKSIKNQTFKDCKLVIMDDCSSDNTYNVVKTILDTTFETDKRIELYKRANHCGLIGKLKNECIDILGDCEYICHVSADDYIEKDCLKTYVDFMDNNPEIGVSYGSFSCFNDEGKKWVFPHVANSRDYDSNILLQYMCLFQLRFYRKKVVEAIGGYSNELTCAVDYDMALRLDETTKIRRLIGPYFYNYRIHSSQVSTSKRKEQDLNAKKALEASLKRRGIYAKVINDAPPFKIQKLKLFGVV